MLKKINVRQLRPGMHIHGFCGSWMEHPFWRENFLLNDPEDIRRIRESNVKEVWIDAGRGIDVEADVQAETVEQVTAAADEMLLAVEPSVELPEQVPLAAEVKRAAAVCAMAKQAVLTMFNEARMGKAVDTAAAGSLVDEISSSVMRNPGALISLARLKTADDYTYMHSVAVCALMVALARQMGLGEAETREAGMAGLLHDLGKALISTVVLNKPGKLTDEEFAIVKSHPEKGYRLLLEGGSVVGIPLDVCLHHHEKVDGSGYPYGLKGNEISLHAKMGAVCDVYDAVTSNRAYKAGWDPAESLHKMAEWCQGHFESSIFYAFVKSIGIYPIGSLVRLESNRLGIVVGQSEASLAKPLVQTFFSTKSQTCVPPELVDLSRSVCSDRIVGREDPVKWGFRNLDVMWAKAA